MPRGSLQSCFLYTLPLLSLASFGKHAAQSHVLPLQGNYSADQQQAPCLPLQNLAWYKQLLVQKRKKKKGERRLQKHKDVDGMFSSLHIQRGDRFPAAARQHVLCICRLHCCSLCCWSCTRRLLHCAIHRQPPGTVLLAELFPCVSSPKHPAFRSMALQASCSN